MLNKINKKLHSRPWKSLEINSQTPLEILGLNIQRLLSFIYLFILVHGYTKQRFHAHSCGNRICSSFLNTRDQNVDVKTALLLLSIFFAMQCTLGEASTNKLGKHLILAFMGS